MRCNGFALPKKRKRGEFTCHLPSMGEAVSQSWSRYLTLEGFPTGHTPLTCFPQDLLAHTFPKPSLKLNTGQELV